MWTNAETVRLLMPEILLIAMATWIYLGGTFSRSRVWWGTFSVAVYVVAGSFLVSSESVIWSILLRDGVSDPSGPLTVDLLGQLIRWLALCCGLFFTLTASRTARADVASEHFATVMVLTAGMMLSARANELVFLFVSLEMVSIPTYVLLCLGRRERSAAEATFKYFFLSVLSSALLLYGLSFLYGISGTTVISGYGDQPGIRDVLSQGKFSYGLLSLAWLLILSGLGFKIAAVPFHFYAPDVYQGVTNPAAGVLAIAPKLAGIIALVRLSWAVAPNAPFAWQTILVLAMLTMTLGNVCALWQTNIRRLLAYSSIAHSGYLLIGLAVGLATVAGASVSGGISATVFYLYVYVLASASAFAALSWLGAENRQISNLSELSGLGRQRPFGAAALAVAMFSLAGIPPLAGFWGKFALFTGTVHLALNTTDPTVSVWFLVLAIVGAVNAAIGAAYYLRLIGVLYFQPSGKELPVEGGLGAWLATAGGALLVLAIGLSPGLALQHASQAEKGLTQTETKPVSLSLSAAKE